jgi:DNA-binding GntR family transcriptional regulator
MVREVLEGLAARLAIANMDDKTLRKMTKCLEEQLKVIEKEDLVGYSRLDYDFHAMVYEASGNKTLQEMLEAIKNKMRPMAMHINPILANLYHDHEAILEAFQQRDPDKAEAAFRSHNHHMIGQIQRGIESDDWKEVYEKPQTGKKRGKS